MKIAIIGKAPSSRLLAPFDDAEFQIWSLSDNYTVLPRWDRWFELHDLQRYKETYGQYYDWLCSQPGGDNAKPIYTVDPVEEMPAAVPYPKDEIIKEFGTYFTNTISWMTALAIHEMKQCDGPHVLHYYGVDMAQDSEYAQQRPSCEYFLGLAVGLGIDIHVPGESDLLKCARLYAFETNRGTMDTKLRARELELQQRQAQHEQERDDAEKAAYTAAGGLQMLTEVAKLNGQLTPEWAQSRDKALREELTRSQFTKREAEKKVYMLLGARENINWSKQWA